MAAERLLSVRNAWVTTSVGLTAAFTALVAAAGLLVLPYAQPGFELGGVWDAICSAAGAPRAASIGASITPDFKASDVVVTSRMLTRPDASAIGRGATLALQCAICHGPDGVSRARSPNLAGQYPGALYKELRDFKEGARTNAVMSPLAAVLSEPDMLDLAAYYAYLPRMAGVHPAAGPPVPRIVINGAPMRNIAPCASCHGGLDTKAGSPWLEGQSAVYIMTQLQAFATGGRRNDISQQMRNVARHMTPDEMDAAARYYGSEP